MEINLKKKIMKNKKNSFLLNFLQLLFSHKLNN